MNLEAIHHMWCWNKIQNFQDFKNDKTTDKLMFLFYVFCVLKLYISLNNTESEDRQFHFYFITKQRNVTYLRVTTWCFIMLKSDLTNLILFQDVQNIEFVNVLLKQFQSVIFKCWTIKGKLNDLPAHLLLMQAKIWYLSVYKLRIVQPSL